MATVAELWGYSPDLQRIASIALPERRKVLLAGRQLVDINLDTAFRFTTQREESLARGVYWHIGEAEARIMVVTEGHPQLGIESHESDAYVQDALAWLEYWWPASIQVPTPRFAKGEVCIHVPTNSNVPVQARIPRTTGWSYEVFAGGGFQTVSEDALRPTRSGSSLDLWLDDPPIAAEDFGVVLTQAKIQNGLTDTLFSYGASKTMFRAYQFKPVLRYLDSHAERILIADEVGLGKTISAALLWTELQARGQAKRTLVVCPAALVDKWKREMEERFNLPLEELTKERLDSLLDSLNSGRFPDTFSYICSLERLRTYEGFNDPETLLECDLVIVDEAHQMRNPESRSFELGIRLSEWTRSLILLSATPLNLGRRDLLSLVRLLLPHEVQTQADLDQRLDHHPALNRLRSSLLDPGIGNSERMVWLQQISGASMGRALAMRPAFDELRDLLSAKTLKHADIPAAREACAALDGLSAVLTRTRKAEVNEIRPVRELVQIDVPWTPAERHFYEEYERWAREVCREYGLSPGFAMQMPLRLAGSCLTAAMQSLESGVGEEEPDYGYAAGSRPSQSVFRAAGATQRLRVAGRKIAGVDSKLEALLAQLRAVAGSGRQILLFTFSRRTLAYLYEKLEREFRVGFLHGGVNREDREHTMRRFREHEYDIVLATRVASEGLDFEFCSIIVNYDLPWNPMEVEQRIGRIDRIGQQEAKIQIWNFATEGTIETRIVSRLLDRIGVFEETIGELEPIMGDTFKRVLEQSMSFDLTAEEKEAELARAEAALEQNRADRAQLNLESSRLQAEERFGIRDVEERIAKGRYLSSHELRRLLDAWAARNGGWVTPVERGTAIDLTVSPSMLQMVADWKLRTGQTSPMISGLQRRAANGPVRLYLDADTARMHGGTLVNTNHPLVQTALRDDSTRDGHFARLRIVSDRAAASSYLVLFGRATWDGLRPTREIWSVAYDLGRNSVAARDVGVEVMSALTKGKLRDAVGDARPDVEHLSILAEALEDRRRDEESRQQRLNAALIEERRIRADESLRRRLVDLESRASKSEQMRRAFEGQMSRARQRHRQEIHEVEAASSCGMSLEPVALCVVEA